MKSKIGIGFVSSLPFPRGFCRSEPHGVTAPCRPRPVGKGGGSARRSLPTSGSNHHGSLVVPAGESTCWLYRRRVSPAGHPRMGIEQHGTLSTIPFEHINMPVEFIPLTIFIPDFITVNSKSCGANRKVCTVFFHRHIF